MSANRTLLVDADIVAFKFAAKGQRSTPFGIAVDDLDDVTPLLDEYLAEMKLALKATGIIICLSDSSENGWRKDILPSYKENRSDVVKPELLGPLKDYLERSYPSYRRDRLEADDIMGILSTMQGLPRNFVEKFPEFADPGQKVIVSEDKDMKTIPGWLFNPAKDTKPRLISEADADRWHLYQSIIGDTTDGYRGCPGAGHEAAEDILNGCYWVSFEHEFKRGPRKGLKETRWSLVPRVGHEVRVWDRVVTLYAKYGLTEADALVQARVARICRVTDYDFKNKKVIPWTPPKTPSSTA